MRKQLLKHEVNDLCVKYKLSGNLQKEIRNALFRNPQLAGGQQFYLFKVEIDTIKKTREELLQIEDSDDFSKFIGEFIKRIELQDKKIPPELHNKFYEGKVAIFVGAGASMLYGYPSWSELADSAIDKLYKDGYLNHYEIKRLLDEVTDPKQKLTIFSRICPKDVSEAFYKNALKKPKENKDQAIKMPKLYDLLVNNDSLFKFIKVTTNLDPEFSKALSRTLKNTPQVAPTSQKLSPDKTQIQSEKSLTVNIPKPEEAFPLSYDKIYHLHGTLNNLDNAVLTTDQYIKAYYKDNSSIRKFLETLFETCTVLFIGYGLEELQILEPIIKKNKRHYTLEPTFFNEVGLLNAKEKYYESFNIQPIPYYIDNKRYNRIETVLEAWKGEFSTLKQLDLLEKNAKVLHDEDKPKIINLIKKDIDHYSQFFQKVTDKAWFEVLDDEGIFDTNNISTFNESYFLPLRFLEHIVKDVNKSQIGRISEILLEVMQDQKTKPDEKKNSLVWNDVAIVLGTMPSKYITKKLLAPLFEFIKQVSGHAFFAFDRLIDNHLLGETVSLKPEIIQYFYEEMFILSENSLDKEKGLLKKSEILELLDNSEKLEKMSKPLTVDMFYLLAQRLSDSAKIPPSYIRSSRNGMAMMQKDALVTINLEDKQIKGEYRQKDKAEGDFFTVEVKNLSTIKSIAQAVEDAVKKIAPHAKASPTMNYEYAVNDLFCDDYTGSTLFRKIDSLSKSHFIHLFSRLLTNIVAKENGEELLKTILEGVQFSNGVKRSAFYAISKTFPKYRDLFTNFIRHNKYFFFINDTKKDWYWLLTEHAKDFSAKELNVFKDVIKLLEEGKQSKALDFSHALQNVSDPFFSEMCQKLLKKHQKEESDVSYRNVNNQIARAHDWGKDSPFTVEQIIDMDVNKLIEQINTFKSAFHWVHGATHDGFSDRLSFAVRRDPIKFIKNITLFEKIPALYLNQIVWGIDEAYPEHRDKIDNNDLEKVLVFYSDIIPQIDKLPQLENIHNFDSSLMRSIARFITTGTRNDEGCFNNSLLPSVKKVVLALMEKAVKQHNEDEELKEMNTANEVMNWLINTTGGDIYTCALDYSLKIGREQKDNKKQVIWDKDIKKAWIEGKAKGLLYSLVIEGSNFSLFEFLDKAWILEQLKEVIHHDYYKLFLGGYVWDIPHGGDNAESILETAMPLYQKAIEEKTMQDKQFSSHMGCYYWWGLIGLDTPIFKQYLTNTENIGSIVHFFWQVTVDMKKKKETPPLRNRSSLFALMRQLIETHEENEKTHKALGGMTNWLGVFNSVTKDEIKVLKSLVPVSTEHINWLVTELHRFTFTIEDELKPLFATLILPALKIALSDIHKRYLFHSQEATAIDLLQFLADNGHLQEALTICRELVKKGFEGYRPMLEKLDKYDK